jgi:solute carrier family 25 phosphate transporter 3
VWTGLGTRCVMVATLSAGMFLIYDTVKLACGLPTSG